MPACLRRTASVPRLFAVRRLHARKKRDGSSSRLSESHGLAWGLCTPGLRTTGMKQRSGHDGAWMRREGGRGRRTEDGYEGIERERRDRQKLLNCSGEQNRAQQS